MRALTSVHRQLRVQTYKVAIYQREGSRQSNWLWLILKQQSDTGAPTTAIILPVVARPWESQTKTNALPYQSYPLLPKLTTKASSQKLAESDSEPSHGRVQARTLVHRMILTSHSLHQLHHSSPPPPVTSCHCGRRCRKMSRLTLCY